VACTNTHVPPDQSQVAVDFILQDMHQRKEFGKFFEQLDHEVKDEIIEAWADIIRRTFYPQQYKCQKALWKSTYKGWAFNLRRIYDVVDEDEHFIWVRDNHGQGFSFSKEPSKTHYYIGDYLKEYKKNVKF
jgi:hypothetical protein